MTTENNMSGAVAVITGATRGLGRAAARQLGEAGARIGVVGRSTSTEPHRLLPGTLEEVEYELRDLGIDVLPVRADLSRLEDARRVVDQTLAWGGQCDVLVNNASYTPVGGFFEVPAQRWSVGWNITVLSTIALCQGFLPGMLERKKGRVLAIGSRVASCRTVPASDWAKKPEGFGPPLLYAVTEAALERVTIGLQDEFGDRGVAFNNLRAGKIGSESFGLKSGQMGYNVPINDVHSPDEIASAVHWILCQPHTCLGRIIDFEWLEQKGIIPSK